MTEDDILGYRDGWGPCCKDCQWIGQAYKPCDVCMPYKLAKQAARECQVEKKGA